MNTTLKDIFTILALCLTLFSNAVPARAGMAQPTEVLIVFDDSPFAMGSMVGARYSKDNSQNIGCTAHTFPSYSWTTCSATDRTGRTVVCGSGAPWMAAIAQAITDSSHVYISLGNSNGNGGECGSIVVVNQSYLLK